MEAVEPTKTCKKCGETFPISDYSINRITKNGSAVLRADCRACRKKAQHEVYLRRKEKKKGDNSAKEE